MDVIYDDLGVAWRYRNGRIVCDGDETEDGGYWCDSLWGGRRLLVEYGYLTDDMPAGVMAQGWIS